MKPEREEPHLYSKQLNLGTLEQQQAIFGIQDENVRLIEKSLSVSIHTRDSKAEIMGESMSLVDAALHTLESLLQAYQNGESINTNAVIRMMDAVEQGDEADTLQAMKNVITLTHKGQPIRCKTTGQKNYVKALKENSVTFCIGPAGTGKTYLAVAQAIEEFKKGEIDKIIMSRPAIEAGEERLGFLPGDLAQKVDPYLRPLYDALNDMLGAERAQKYQDRGTIEVAPLAYMRGRTLNHARIIIDESQNASTQTLKMALTRLGEGSRMVLTGDVTQIDLPRGTDSGLEKCAAILNGIEDIAVIRLTERDVIRHKLVRDIVKAFEKAEKKQGERAGVRKPKNITARRRN